MVPGYPVWRWPSSSHDEGRLWLFWLVRLRWVAIVAQVLTVAAVWRILAGPAVIAALAAIVIGLVGANLRATWRVRTRAEVLDGDLVAHLGLDVVALTGFFLMAGGPANPFTTLYLIHVAMAAVMLRPRLAAGLTALTIGCYALLHVGHLPLDLDQHGVSHAVLAAAGRLIAFAVAAVTVTVFVVGLATTLRWRSRELLEARDRTARIDRLRAVGTLAAGAAHELNTPLSTVDLRLRRVARRHTDADTVEDLAQVRRQLERCTGIVQQLLVGAGDPAASGLAPWPLFELVEAGVALWSKGSSTGVSLADRSDGLVVEVPRIAFTQALVNLLENGREAQAGADTPLEVDVVRDADGNGVVVVRDRGCGLPDDVERVGDPFFTTKPTGTGLGVYVARNVADGSGGGLRYVRRPDGGTEARWWFPARAT